MEVAKRLGASTLDNPSFSDILDALDQDDFFIFIDGAYGLEPGEVKVVPLEEFSSSVHKTSHDLSLAEAFSIKRFQGRDIKGFVILIGIKSVEPGFHISLSLNEIVDKVKGIIVKLTDPR